MVSASGPNPSQYYVASENFTDCPLHPNIPSHPHWAKHTLAVMYCFYLLTVKFRYNLFPRNWPFPLLHGTVHWLTVEHTSLWFLVKSLITLGDSAMLVSATKGTHIFEFTFDKGINEGKPLGLGPTATSRWLTLTITSMILFTLQASDIFSFLWSLPWR